MPRKSPCVHSSASRGPRPIKVAAQYRISGGRVSPSACVGVYADPASPPTSSIACTRSTAEMQRLRGAGDLVRFELRGLVDYDARPVRVRKRLVLAYPLDRQPAGGNAFRWSCRSNLANDATQKDSPLLIAANAERYTTVSVMTKIASAIYRALSRPPGNPFCQRRNCA